MPDRQPPCLGGKHITETKVWTAHITVRPGLKVVNREVLEKRVGFINRRRRIGIRDDERYIRVVRRGKYRGTGPAPSLERYEAGDVAAGGPR
jgi:hypothetical protein